MEFFDSVTMADLEELLPVDENEFVCKFEKQVALSTFHTTHPPKSTISNYKEPSFKNSRTTSKIILPVINIEIPKRINDGASCSKTYISGEDFLEKDKVIGSPLNSLDNTNFPLTSTPLTRPFLTLTNTKLLPQVIPGLINAGVSSSETNINKNEIIDNNHTTNLIRLQREQHEQLSDDNTMVTSIGGSTSENESHKSLTDVLENIKFFNYNLRISDTFKIIFQENVNTSPLMTIGTMSDIYIPITLRELHHYDFESVLLEKKISEFPIKYSISEVIHEYILYKTKFNDISKDKVINFGIHLLDLFNITLHRHILYKIELDKGIELLAFKHFLLQSLNKKTVMQQYHEKRLTKQIWCYVYSPIYLIRLLTVLPTIMYDLPCEQEDLNFYSYCIHDFLCYLENHCDKYFQANKYISTKELKKL